MISFVSNASKTESPIYYDFKSEFSIRDENKFLKLSTI